MKVIKAMKKLKFWSRKKKKKKKFFLTESPPPPSRPPPPPPPPPQFYPSYSQYEPLLPSAPPLPPWLEYDLQFQETLSTTEVMNSASSSKSNFPPTDTISAPELSPPEFQANTCYQQHNMVYNNPVVVPQLKKLERGVGAFGCAVSFGVHLVRCVFPCFHIREEVDLNKESYVIS